MRKIKEYLKSVVLEATEIPEEYIYFGIAESNQYNTPPFCKIITDKSTIKELFEKEKRYGDEEIKLVTRKYSITMPVLVGFAGENETIVSNWVYEFLKRLKRYIKIDEQGVFLNPTNIEYSDTISVMSAYISVIEVECVYGVYEETEFDRMSDINEEVEYRR